MYLSAEQLAAQKACRTVDRISRKAQRHVRYHRRYARLGGHRYSRDIKYLDGVIYRLRQLAPRVMFSISTNLTDR